mmetsp:Transcript_5879/g.9517  ORF Transcript_5879/g.9517 Transcript_5879/m.9517 type:complete len:80 (-) Transcript_5879:2077-2316(-)
MGYSMIVFSALNMLLNFGVMIYVSYRHTRLSLQKEFAMKKQTLHHLPFEQKRIDLIEKYNLRLKRSELLKQEDEMQNQN